MSQSPGMEQEKRFAAKHGDFPTFERLGGSRAEYEIIRNASMRLSPRIFSRGIV